MPVIIFYLRKLAIVSSPSNMKQLEERLKQAKKKEDKMLAEINSVISKLKESPLNWALRQAQVVRYSEALPRYKSAVPSANRKDTKLIARE